MFRPRIIPVLLLKGHGLVKSVKFRNYRYIGDPINAVRLFNDLRADEIVFLDITATNENRVIATELLEKIAEEANVPFSIGGGITRLEQIRELLKSGAERVILGTVAIENPDFIIEAASRFGSSSVSVCIDVKTNIFGQKVVAFRNGSKNTSINPLDFAVQMEQNGAGELIIQSIDHDGTMVGYDFEIIKKISQKVTIPVVALGGAGSLLDFRQAYEKSFATAVAAGSLFIFHGPRRGILINYPDKEEIKKIF